MSALTLRTKLRALIGLAVGSTLLAGAVAVATIGSVRIGSTAHDRILASKDLVADVLPPPNYLVETTLVAFRVATTADPATRDELRSQLTRLGTEFDDRLAVWTDRLPAGPLRDAFLGELTVSAQDLRAVIDRDLLPAIDRGDQAAALAVAEGPLTDAFERHRRAVLTVVDQATTEQRAVTADADGLVRTRLAVLLGVLGALVVLAAFTGRWLVRSITEPLQRLTAVANGIAARDLRQEITDDDGDDEIGQLARSFRATIDGLGSALDDIDQRATAVARAAQELTAVNRDLEQTAAQTAQRAATNRSASTDITDAVSQVATAVEELSSSMEEIARNAAAAAQVASNGVGLAGTTRERMSRLRASTEEIAGVLGMIAEVAEQTNLLALNATIEAARSGEAGKGFAVVANEVKVLAAQTAQATDQITRRIVALRHDTDEADRALDRMTAIVGDIDQYQSAIAAAVEEQVATGHAVGRNIVEASESGRRIATDADQVAAEVAVTVDGIRSSQDAAADLRRMAGDLERLVATFRH
jgi:methyl-accepting chemotaxis protein